MMKLNKKILVAALSATLFASVAVGTTFALFSTQATANNHLIAGNVEAKLYLTSLVVDQTNATTGVPENNVTKTLSTMSGYDSETGWVDLSSYTGPVFEVTNIAPTYDGTATFRLVNTGSIAFNAQASYTKTADNAQQSNILEQVLVSFNGIGTGTNVTQVNKGGYVEFTMHYLFQNLDDSVNNAAMLQGLKIDISVSCVQLKLANE